MAFVAPVWNAEHSHYVISLVSEFASENNVPIGRDNAGNTGFTDNDVVLNVTDNILHALINDGDKYKWFSKLPSHEQLMKRVKHSFQSLATQEHNAARPVTLLLTPKQITFVWNPVKVASAVPPMYVDDSEDESESSAGTEPELQDSQLPPVALTDLGRVNEEEYLLTRLRAAKARVETEQIRMQYFETTGHMPPDSESESEFDDE